MFRRLIALALLVAAAAGGVVAWQRRNETPATAPTALRPTEPFMAPAPSPGEGEPTAVVADAVVADAVVDPLPGPPRGAPADPLPSPPRDPAIGGRDDLKRLSGVGPKIEAILHSQGITTFAQLAALDEDGIDALQARLPQFPGRIRRDDWVGQARRLAGQ